MKECPVNDIHVARSDVTHNAVLYSYPCGNIDIIAASAQMFLESGYESARDVPKGAPRESGKKSAGADMLRSMRRARARVRRLALANDFQYFVTLTLDQMKIDRYDGAAITRALSAWADNMVRRSGLRYILVPERHKDSAFHFHGFFAGDGLQVVPSGHSDSAGREIFNLPQWRYGFSTAQKLYGDYPAAVAYTCKYIGKQDGERPLGRWYYSGGALHEPEKAYLDIDLDDFRQEYPQAYEIDIPSNKIYVVHTKKEIDNCD